MINLSGCDLEIKREKMPVERIIDV